MRPSRVRTHAHVTVKRRVLDGTGADARLPPPAPPSPPTPRPSPPHAPVGFSSQSLGSAQAVQDMNVTEDPNEPHWSANLKSSSAEKILAGKKTIDSGPTAKF